MNANPLRSDREADSNAADPSPDDTSARAEERPVQVLNPEQAARVWRAIEEWPEACKTKGDGPFTAG
jgi:hypothetical protein